MKRVLIPFLAGILIGVGGFYAGIKLSGNPCALFCPCKACPCMKK